MLVALRQAAPDDSAFVYETKKAAFREYVEQVWGWDEDQQRQLHERRFSCQDVRIVQCDGVDVGYVALDDSDECLRLNQLYLLPEHQSRGIGRRCMDLIADEARDKGKYIWLRVMKVNPRARRFYERMGFTETGQTDAHHEMVLHP